MHIMRRKRSYCPGNGERGIESETWAAGMLRVATSVLNAKGANCRKKMRTIQSTLNTVGSVKTCSCNLRSAIIMESPKNHNDNDLLADLTGIGALISKQYQNV